MSGITTNELWAGSNPESETAIQNNLKLWQLLGEIVDIPNVRRPADPELTATAQLLADNSTATWLRYYAEQGAPITVDEELKLRHSRFINALAREVARPMESQIREIVNGSNVTDAFKRMVEEELGTFIISVDIREKPNLDQHQFHPTLGLAPVETTGVFMANSALLMELYAIIINAAVVRWTKTSDYPPSSYDFVKQKNDAHRLQVAQKYFGGDLEALNQSLDEIAQNLPENILQIIQTSTLRDSVW